MSSTLSCLNNSGEKNKTESENQKLIIAIVGKQNYCDNDKDNIIGFKSAKNLAVLKETDFFFNIIAMYRNRFFLRRRRGRNSVSDLRHIVYAVIFSVHYQILNRPESLLRFRILTALSMLLFLSSLMYGRRDMRRLER